MIERAQARTHKAEQAVECMFSRSEAYRLTLGEVMLALYIRKTDQSTLKIGLSCRKRAVYTTETEDTDIASSSGIEIPENHEIGVIPISDLEKSIQDNSKVAFKGIVVDRTYLADSLCQLFAVIREYENQSIQHPAGYTDAGTGRNAHVSVTGMGQLKEFDLEELKKLPDTYHTKYANPGVIHLPPESKVSFLPIPIRR